MEKFEKVTVYVCESCNDAFDTMDDNEKLYECGNCGTIFSRSQSANDNHQCPDCYKFASVYSEDGCSSCGQGEVKEEDGWKCLDCEEFVSDGDTEEHLEDHQRQERRLVIKEGQYRQVTRLLHVTKEWAYIEYHRTVQSSVARAGRIIRVDGMYDDKMVKIHISREDGRENDYLVEKTHLLECTEIAEVQTEEQVMERI